MINCVIFSTLTFLLFLQLCHIVCAKQRCDESVQGAKRRKFHPQSYGWVTAPNIKCEICSRSAVNCQYLVKTRWGNNWQMTDPFDRLIWISINIGFRYSIIDKYETSPSCTAQTKLAKDAEFETRLEKSLISSPVAAFPRSELRLVEGRESKRDDVTFIMTLKEHIHIDTHMG